MTTKEETKLFVSSEIADDIDESQFFEDSETETKSPEEAEDEISSALIVHFTTEKTLVPGIVLSYEIKQLGMSEVITVKFLTDNSNLLAFESESMFDCITILCGDQSIRIIDLTHFMRTKFLVEQDLNKMGSIITVVYS